jgi:hypothetical protein
LTQWECQKSPVCLFVYHVFFFYSQLPLDHLKEKLSAEMEKLKEMAPHLSQQSDDQGMQYIECFQ